MTSYLQYIKAYRRELGICTATLGGWITFKYLPYTRLVYDVGLLLTGTQQRSKLEVERLRGIGYQLEKELDYLSQINNYIPRTLIEQAVDDISRSRNKHLDVSRVNFATTLAVHVGSEYHSGSLKNGAFIVLPGTFGLTEAEKAIFKSAKYYFDNSAMIFSLLDKKTWKFMVAKELLFLEDERNMMKFSMYLGSLLFSISFLIFGFTLPEMKLRIRLRGAMQQEKIQYLQKVRYTKNAFYLSTFLLVCSIFLYKTLFYIYCTWKTKKLDRTLASLGPDYIQGGKDYFQKMQDAGYFQRHLLANKKYSTIGNEELSRFLYLIPKKVTREERLKFYSNLADNLDDLKE